MLLKSVVIKKDNLTTVNLEKFSEEIFIKCIFTATKQTVAI